MRVTVKPISRFSQAVTPNEAHGIEGPPISVLTQSIHGYDARVFQSARDFRLESIGPSWIRTPLSNRGDNLFQAYVAEPTTGWTAFLVEMVFEDGVILSTQAFVTPDILPFEGQACQ